MSKHMVHNHGPEEGPGMACPERLIGDCELARLRAENQRLREASSALVSELTSMAHDSATVRSYFLSHQVGPLLEALRDALKGDNP